MRWGGGGTATIATDYHIGASDAVPETIEASLQPSEAVLVDVGVPLLLANVTQQVYQMARAAGLNKEDGSSIIKVFERMAGVTIGGGDD